MGFFLVVLCLEDEEAVVDYHYKVSSHKNNNNDIDLKPLSST